MSADKSEIVATIVGTEYGEGFSLNTDAFDPPALGEEIRLVPESLLLDARAEGAIWATAAGTESAQRLKMQERAERAEALAGERLALLVEYRNAPKFGDDKTIRATIAIEDRIDTAIDAGGGRGE